MTSQERFAVNYQVEHLQTKYVGTGHADTSKLCALARAVFSMRTRQRAARASWHARGALTYPLDTLASAPLAPRQQGAPVKLRMPPRTSCGRCSTAVARPPSVGSRCPPRVHAPRRVARSEWAVNQHRDSLALYVGYDPLSQFFAVAENESIGRVKFSSLQVLSFRCPAPRPRT